ncbi:Type II secretion system protein G [Paludisphaera borealis]|uniref:Type II secretion system protein G n=2 Tax=Paludisphaera borealis TaxID=1387353 RepID=A0A1U7CZ17_9BACT|nr:Type II secretion system protein G [Paludisphaera borealis]
MTAGRRRSPTTDGRSGYTLIEAMVVLVVMAIVMSMGVPRFSRSLEQTRADVAAANLRAIWTAERLYWLENRRYADLSTLMSRNLVDASVCASTFYAYSATPSGDGFVAVAERGNSGTWGGRLEIDQGGTLNNLLTNSGGDVVPSVAP